MKNYEHDIINAMKKQNDLIVQQVFIELIQVVAECETYEEFRKRMYGIALSYVKDHKRERAKTIAPIAAARFPHGRANVPTVIYLL